MAFKYPWTNYHELNLNWILDELKKIFEKTQENNVVVEQYDSRLTEVELLAGNADTASNQAQSNSAAALSMAQFAVDTANAANVSAASALQGAGAANVAAGQSMEQANAAYHLAEQAQNQTANFDGRITQAENNAAAALQAASSFDDRVNAAISTANNAANTSTIALERATSAETKASQVENALNNQQNTLNGIIDGGIESINTASRNAQTAIEDKGLAVLDSLPNDYVEGVLDVQSYVKALFPQVTIENQEIANFDNGADGLPIIDLLADIVPFQAGTGNPSPNNVRPISGFDGVKVTRAGKNLFSYNLPIRNGYWNNASFVGNNEELTLERAIGWQYIRIPVEAGREITISGTNPQGGTYSAFLGSEDPTDIISVYSNANNNGTHIVPDGARYLGVVLYNMGGTHEAYNQAQIEFGSVATNYEPYTDTTVELYFDEAGTIYGGQVDLTTGELTVDRLIASSLNNFRWSYHASSSANDTNRFSAIVPDTLKQYSAVEIADIVSNKYVACSQIDIIVGGPTRTGYIALYKAPSSNIIIILDNNYDNVDDFINGLTDLQIVWPLATPITYQLTPQRNITTLLGVNNIWSDTGNIAKLTYRADLAKWIAENTCKYPQTKTNVSTDKSLLTPSIINSDKTELKDAMEQDVIEQDIMEQEETELKDAMEQEEREDI